MVSDDPVPLDPARGRRKIMKQKVVRSVLTILLVAVAVFNIAEGILLLTGVRTPAVHYQGTLFIDATVPMVLLAIVVGGSALLAAATVFIRREWAVLVLVLAGVVMAGYLVVEIVSLDSKVGNALPTMLAFHSSTLCSVWRSLGWQGFSRCGNIAVNTSTLGLLREMLAQESLPTVIVEVVRSYEV
jgi:hypothetical protein